METPSAIQRSPSFKSRGFLTLHASRRSCRNLIGDYFYNFYFVSLCVSVHIQKALKIDFSFHGEAKVLWKTERLRLRVSNSNQESRIFHEIVL